MLHAAPLFFPARSICGNFLRERGDAEGSIREQQKALEQNPKDVIALLFLATAYTTAGDVGSARRALERARSLEPKRYSVRLLWAIQLGLEGKRDEALIEMDPEVLKYAELIFFSSNAAEFYAVLGEKTKARDWLDRAVRVGDERAEWFERNPLLKNISDEPRFRQVLESVRHRREQRPKSTR
jgi:tetratricopeptide (TPR) repeat protein